MHFWRTHAIYPVSIYSVMMLIFNTSDLDVNISRIFFNHASNKWLYGESWWANVFIHEWGRNLIALIFLILLLGYVLSFLVKSLQPLRFKLGYASLTIVLSTAIVAVLKQYSNIDCPWDLSLFNGTRPYFHVFSDKLDNLEVGKCFPGGHSSGGFSLFLFYFVFRDYNRRKAYSALLFAIVLGSVFGLAQWARGAHFASHDMTSAMICWLVALWLYKLIIQPKVLVQQAGN